MFVLVLALVHEARKQMCDGRRRRPQSLNSLLLLAVSASQSINHEKPSIILLTLKELQRWLNIVSVVVMLLVLER